MPLGEDTIYLYKADLTEKFLWHPAMMPLPSPIHSSSKKNQRGRQQSREGCLSLYAHEVMAGLHVLRFSTFYSLSFHPAYKLSKWQSSRNMYETDLEMHNLTEKASLEEHKISTH